MKILVTAYACEPGKGSEPGAGWQLVSHIAHRHDVWVITRSNNEGPIREAVSEAGRSLRFSYHDIPLLLRFKRLPGGVWIYHYLWHLSAVRLARRLHQREKFDIAHHLTLGSFRFPGRLQRLGVPVVIGPVGGAEEPPVSFWPGMGARGALTECLRWLSNRLARIDPLLRRSMRSASIVLTVSNETRRAVQRIAGPRVPVYVLPQAGVDPSQLGPPGPTDYETAPGEGSSGPRSEGTATCRLLQVGRLEGWKGAHLSLRAVAEARRRGTDVAFTLLGRGPRASDLEQMADRLEIRDIVTFIERLPTLDDVIELYRQHDVFLFPSLRESGGMALLEAMGTGRPAIALALGGPGLSVSSDTGILVVPTEPDAVVKDMAAAIQRLALDASLRRSMGTKAIERVSRNYSWISKGNAIDRCYRGIGVDLGSSVWPV